VYTIIDSENCTEITEEITEIDLFGLLQEEIHIEEIDTVLSGTGESMDHGRTRTMSGTGESMSHGRTEDARRIDDGNPAVAGANPDLSLTDEMAKLRPSSLGTYYDYKPRIMLRKVKTRPPRKRH